MAKIIKVYKKNSFIASNKRFKKAFVSNYIFLDYFKTINYCFYITKIFLFIFTAAARGSFKLYLPF